MHKIGIGVTTYNRPAYAEKCLRSLVANVPPDAPIVLFNDGSDPKHNGSYRRAYRFLLRRDNVTILDQVDNHGVAWAKNRLCESLLDHGCDWVFLLEDDVLLRSPDAVNKYVEVATRHEMHHLAFAHHGMANVGGPVEARGDIAFYPHSVGAWCLYSREWLVNVGMFDENMINAFEHVEMELRGFQLGYAPGAGPHRFPDAAESHQWLSEIVGSLENSAIRVRDDWAPNIYNALSYWEVAKPETFAMMFGPGTPLANYANRILGKEARYEPTATAGAPR
jgi:GT2 family glycosyltransferase